MYQGNVLVAGTYTNSSGQVTVFHGVCEQFVQKVHADEISTYEVRTTAMLILILVLA